VAAGSSVWKRTLRLGALLGEEAWEDQAYGTDGMYTAVFPTVSVLTCTNECRCLIELQEIKNKF
jgi:hypothetical protein